MKKLFVMLGGIFLIVFSVTYAFKDNIVVDGDLVLPISSPIVQQTATLSKPRMLSIPKLSLATEIEEVGLDSEQRMDVPQAWENVGWYKLGPVPGEPGSSVIAGHLDSPTGPAVFFELDRLDVNDEVVVTDESGTSKTFTVIGKQKYKDETFPLQQVFADENGVFLNLITCSGTFNRVNQRYSDRLVVFTKLDSASQRNH